MISNIYEKFHDNIEKIKIVKDSKEHLIDVNMNYKEHFLFSINLARIFLNGLLCSVVHSFIPGYFKTSSSDNCNILSQKLDDNTSKQNQLNYVEN
jgi:archaellum component FlaF (FlaF/FlaG flagellin family)